MYGAAVDFYVESFRLNYIGAVWYVLAVNYSIKVNIYTNNQIKEHINKQTC